MFIFIDIGHRWKARAAEMLHRMGYDDTSKAVLDLDTTRPPVAERPLRDWQEEAARRTPRQRRLSLLRRLRLTLGIVLQPYFRRRRR